MAILDGFMGSLEVFVHQARDIHNICIYQKQDVYARLRLTSDPEICVSTKIINGGGKHPVFNETLHLNVRTLDSSLKCELWMLSRVKNYLEDQLLGFALVPFSQFVAGNGKTMREFELSSTDLFHSPAGFVSLTISYTGSTEDLMAPTSTVRNDLSTDVSNDESIPCEYANLEFPDLNVANENKMMISEYLGIPCPNSESQNGDECLISANCFDCPPEKNVDIFSTDCEALSAAGAAKNDSPLSIVSSSNSESSGITGSPNQKGEKSEIAAISSEKQLLMPVININIEPEQPVVQQDIVDLYMKSMQQFTESLAKMKFPLNFENSSSSNNNNNIDNGKDEASEKRGARVFYGSRAFF
ncbi:hypothetical protein KSP40_PGU022777 [Platanthera guangdongensis]|uniref:C2 domain-containing protein n=1 Tax=Platanthera guangdongensis TaxID=2320717 RepID=A0ABR2MFA7_9ASPA